MNTENSTGRVAVITGLLGYRRSYRPSAGRRRPSRRAAGAAPGSRPGLGRRGRETKAAAEQMYEATAITPQDIAEIIAFTVSRPRSVSLNEILVRPTAQEL